jgi:hypothetical protein
MGSQTYAGGLTHQRTRASVAPKNEYPKSAANLTGVYPICRARPDRFYGEKRLQRFQPEIRQNHFFYLNRSIQEIFIWNRSDLI